MRSDMTTTTFSIEGYRVTRTLGVVRGSQCAHALWWAPLGPCPDPFGGNITILSELCERARTEAFELMCQHADGVGANAVLGVRYDATELIQNASEVLCYGTAVVVEQEAAITAGR